MGEVVSIKGETDVRGAEATAAVVAWLREYADRLESGESRPVEKAVLLTYENIGDQFRVSTAYCNATTIERAGMLSLSLHDTADLD
jgi:hypothetical protein